MLTSIKISTQEYEERVSRLSEYMQAKKLSGLVLFDRDYILYYTGFAFIPTERPICFLMNRRGDKTLFVPRLEVEHAQTNAVVENVEHYIEYPFEPHPMELLRKVIVSMGNNEKIGADNVGYPWQFGYRGPNLAEIINGEFEIISGFIEDQMMVKSKAEVNLIRESVKWGHLAHRLLQKYTKVGLSETEVTQRASNEATLTMLDTIGPIYQAQSPFSRGASAGYRGQIGRNAAIPHAMSNNITFQEGDILVTGAGAPVWGYNSELERTMIIGRASDDQKRYFDHMVALQDIAFDALIPGDPCSEVDKKVRVYYEANGLMDSWRHHVGHAIGIRYHEGPFLDLGDQTIILPGMVFTIEPGIYSAELGGFRHSDTVVITDMGIEILTYYPRDLVSLTLSV